MLRSEGRFPPRHRNEGYEVIHPQAAKGLATHTSLTVPPEFLQNPGCKTRMRVYGTGARNTNMDYDGAAGESVLLQQGVAK